MMIGLAEERHPLKQGLKLIRSTSLSISVKSAEERHPLKQGLKQEFMSIIKQVVKLLKRDIH